MSNPNLLEPSDSELYNKNLTVPRARQNRIAWRGTRQNLPMNGMKSEARTASVLAIAEAA